MMLDRRRFWQGSLAAAGLLVLPRPGMTATISLGQKDVLLVIDVQNCFLPGGTLAVADGDAVIPVINRIAPLFQNIVLTQDWHTPRHASFASSHQGAAPFTVTHLSYGDQVLWPDHCVQGTPDAALSDRLDLPKAELILRKGYRQSVDSYSAFLEADHISTGLAAYLQQRGLKRVFLAGLATDFCVAWSAIDATKLGFKAFVIEDACRGIDTNSSLAKAWSDMAKAGVQRIKAADLGAA